MPPSNTSTGGRLPKPESCQMKRPYLPSPTNTQHSSKISRHMDSSSEESLYVDLSDDSDSFPESSAESALRILGRTPSLRVQGADGREYASFTLFLASAPLFGELEYMKLRFFSGIAETLTQFMELGAEVSMSGAPLKLDKNQNVDIKAEHTSNFCTSHLTRICKFIFKNPSRTTLKVHVCFNHNLFTIYPAIPHRPSNINRLSGILDRSNSPLRVWNCSLANIDDLVTESRLDYHQLVSLTTEFETSFYGVITDVSRTVRISKLPKVGRVAIMNVDVVDPSIVSAFKSALVLSNPAK